MIQALLSYHQYHQFTHRAPRRNRIAVNPLYPTCNRATYKTVAWPYAHAAINEKSISLEFYSNEQRPGCIHAILENSVIRQRAFNRFYERCIIRITPPSIFTTEYPWRLDSFITTVIALLFVYGNIKDIFRSKAASKVGQLHTTASRTLRGRQCQNQAGEREGRLT